MANERLSLYFNTENETERKMWEYITKDGKYGKSKNAKRAFEIMLEVEGIIPPIQLNRIFAESILNDKTNALAGALSTTLVAQPRVEEEPQEVNIIHSSEDDDDIEIDYDILN